jgi:UDP-N-acetylmuramoyl-L-alanyl-D-glutamate--2,6-diaminopimelate ligase
MLRTPKELIRRLVPALILARALSFYHFALAALGAAYFGYPSRHLFVVGVTGTKGKTTLTELLNAIFEEAGHTTALMNSIRFKVADRSWANLTRLSMPGRFFIQKFLGGAVRSGCTAAILEMTSEGARQHRHRCLDMHALVVINRAPEHIESHGSFEAYANTKYEIGKQLVRSIKRPRIIVANIEDKESTRYLALPVEHALPFALSALPSKATERGGTFEFEGVRIAIHLPGTFSLRNALAAATLAHAIGIRGEVIARALGKIEKIPGRAERIEAGQPFTVVVDYAHTPDSLLALYDAYSAHRKICVLSATGGGRDTWKRSVMGRIAEEKCAAVILTNEDPYDEDPKQIVEDIAHGMSKRPDIILDRREAIRAALALAREGDAVLITGKGTDPSICGPRGTKIPWSDARVAREELQTLLKKGLVQ